MRVAVIDIGKTNKKVIVYDQQLQPVAQASKQFPAIQQADGVLVEQVDQIWSWLKAQLRSLYQAHPFAGIVVSTHGATIACLDQDGDQTLPVIAYEHALDQAQQQALDQQFYQLVGGDRQALQQSTGTCDLPLLINPAKQLLFIKQRYPDAFRRTAHVVNYPQFWAHKLSGQLTAEPTFSMNHSFLYDLSSSSEHGVPSSMAQALGLGPRLAQRFARPWDQAGVLRGRLQAELGLPALAIAVGVHDSNAALLPYLLAYPEQDFVLNSTGTWCVAMHQVDQPEYLAGELDRSIIFNRDCLGGWQKVSFLMGGQEYDAYHQLIGGEHGEAQAARLEQSFVQAQRGVAPGTFPSQYRRYHGGVFDGQSSWTLAQLQSGQTPEWWSDPALAHDLLNASLALQTEVALAATGMNDNSLIFIEGGFRNNPVYLQLLAARFGADRVFSTSFEAATATGTAILGLSMLHGADPQMFAQQCVIERHVVQAQFDHSAWQAYAEAWHQRFPVA